MWFIDGYLSVDDICNVRGCIENFVNGFVGFFDRYVGKIKLYVFFYFVVDKFDKLVSFLVSDVCVVNIVEDEMEFLFFYFWK